MVYFNKNKHLIKSAIKYGHKRKCIYVMIQHISNSNVVKQTSTDKKSIMSKEGGNFLKVLKTNSTIANEIGQFSVDKNNTNLLHDRILFKPSNYDKLIEFIQFLEKNEINKDYDIYFYEEKLSNIKLNREQNKKEIFINAMDIMNDNKIKKYEKRAYLEKRDINSIYYYNIQRYKDNVDPSAFLVDRKRLTKEEYAYQYISTILSYVFFIFMLFFPHILICLFIPYIKKKNEMQKELCKVLQINQSIHSYKDIKPEEIINVIDNNLKTIIFFYNSNIFLNLYIKSLLVDLSHIFIDNSIPVNIVGIDTSKHAIRYNVINDFSNNTFPMLYFVLPYNYDNDSAVLKIEKPLSVESIVSQIRNFVHIPHSTYIEIKALDIVGIKLKRCVFEHDVMNKSKGDIIYDYGGKVAYLSCLQLNNKSLFH